MNKKQFYEVYLPALSIAFENETEDNINDPEFYISDKELYKQIIDYTENTVDDSFLDMVAYYYDAKAHNFPEVDGVEINEYRSNIIKEIPILKKKYDIK